MVPPSWNDRARVAAHRERLTTSSRPTAVAVSLLDVCAPAIADRSRERLPQPACRRSRRPQPRWPHGARGAPVGGTAAANQSKLINRTDLMYGEWHGRAAGVTAARRTRRP